MKRKIRRKYRRGQRNSWMKFIGIIGIMIMAILCGYLTARFAIAPLLGYDAEVLKINMPSVFLNNKDETTKQTTNQSTAETKESTTDGKEKKSSSGYGLQFGLFSTEEKATELKNKLAASSIETEIRKIDGKYKVIGFISKSKEEAVAQLKQINREIVKDVFITIVK